MLVMITHVVFRGLAIVWPELVREVRMLYSTIDAGHTQSMLVLITGTVVLAADSIDQVVNNIRLWLLGILSGWATLCLTVGFLRYVILYRRRHLARTLACIAQHGPHATVVHLTSRRQAEQFVARLSCREGGR